MPSRYLSHSSRSREGFTIIEVLIVLVIAGLILLIIFWVVPTLQRNARNYDRRNYVGLIYSVLLEAYSNNSHFAGSVGNPASAANQTEICTFLKTLPRVDSSATCGHNSSSFTSINGAISADCTTVQAGPYTICYQNWETVSHGYIGPTDEISIMLAHWCNVPPNTDLSQPATFPVAGNDTNTERFAIWTSLEGVQRPLCLDNMPER